MRKPLTAAVFAPLLATKPDDVHALPGAYLDECETAAAELSASIADVLEESAASLNNSDGDDIPAVHIASLQLLCASNLHLLNDVRTALTWAHDATKGFCVDGSAPARSTPSTDVKALAASAALMGERLAPMDVRANHSAIYPAIDLARGLAEALADKAACAGLIAAHVDADGAEELAADLSQLARYAAKLAEALPVIDGATAVLGDAEEEEE